MPRRDVVLTGLIAFGAGVAVGANWKKLRKQAGPLLEKLGLQIADLGDFLSAAGVEEFTSEAIPAETNGHRSRSRRRSKVKATQNGQAFVPENSRRNGNHAGPTSVSPLSKRKAPRRKPVVVRETEAPVVN